MTWGKEEISCGVGGASFMWSGWAQTKASCSENLISVLVLIIPLEMHSYLFSYICTYPPFKCGLLS